MLLHRLVAHHQRAGDRRVAAALGHQRQHLAFAVGERSERAVAAAEAGADALLLDNLGPEDAGKAVVAAREALGDRRCLIEASGGITLETVGRYAGMGVDAVSAGALTDSAKALDLGLDVETEAGAS